MEALPDINHEAGKRCGRGFGDSSVIPWGKICCIALSIWAREEDNGRSRCFFKAGRPDRCCHEITLRAAAIITEVHILTTTRSKRWNGNIDTLKAPYLTGVLTQMGIYGERVQFALVTSGNGPHYQLTNTAGKKMAFDGNHHLHHPEEGEFAPGNATGVFTLDQVRLAKAGGSKTTRTLSTGGVKRASTTRAPSAATRAKDQVDSDKYEYFKANRATLPDTIGEHSEEITTLMRGGMPAEQAFGEVVKKYF